METMLLTPYVESPPRKSRWRWSVPWAAGLLLLVFAGMALVLLVQPALGWRNGRVYTVPSAVPYPPPGMSGVSGFRGGWTRQSVRVGNCVLEWMWMPRGQGAFGR